MSTTLVKFEFHGRPVRTVVIDGVAWFVVADVAAILGYRDAGNAARLLRPAQRGDSDVSTPGGIQRMLVTNESGLNRLILRSNRPEAEQIQEWVEDEVLPSIRKTGSYSRELSRLELIDMAREAEVARLEAVAERDTLAGQVAELEPAAQAWDELVDTGTTLDVGSAAKKLCENGVLMGRTRLYAYLREIGWVFAYGTQPKQSAVDTGYVTVDWGKAYVNAKTGETEQGDAKTRVTARGLRELLRRLTPEVEAS